MQELQQNYLELIEKLKLKRDKYPEKALCILIPEVGKSYANNILFVGRATNGWGNEIDTTSIKSFDDFSKYLSKKISFGNMQWIYDHLNNKESNYNPNRSAFWRTIKAIANGYNKINIGNEIFNHIAWSNVYKIAGYDKNPTSKLIKIQKDIVVNIFKKEVSLINPEIIIFLTSIWWAEPFLPKNYLEFNTKKYKYIKTFA